MLESSGDDTWHVAARGLVPEAEAQDKARWVREEQVTGRTAQILLEQIWNRDLSAYDPDGPLPDVEPALDAPSFIAGRALWRTPWTTSCRTTARTGSSSARAWRRPASASSWTTSSRCSRSAARCARSTRAPRCATTWASWHRPGQRTPPVPPIRTVRPARRPGRSGRPEQAHQKWASTRRFGPNRGGLRAGSLGEAHLGSRRPTLRRRLPPGASAGRAAPGAGAASSRCTTPGTRPAPGAPAPPCPRCRPGPTARSTG